MAWRKEIMLMKKGPQPIFFLGDFEIKIDLIGLWSIDYVVHAAANKIVTTAEYNPFETVNTNILGAMNLIDVCINRGIKKVIIFLSM